MEKSLSKAQFLEFVRSRGKVQAAIFRLPGFTNHNVHPDWMHTVDEGFGALICGQVLSHLLPEYGKKKMSKLRTYGRTSRNSIQHSKFLGISA